ncbi:phosphatidylinositol-specific phospholipase C1-like protein [Aquiflexum sp.]|uniref:phosphatidylinositol-specific phospholipase C1-like protein n=1 Tax=Aquiflexum sp. TaxID=1872584 RepID=UPI003593BE3E
MNYSKILYLSACLLFSFQPLFGQKLNETQVIGSHNSYKSSMPAPILEYLNKINPTAAQSLEYEHLPLSEQLDLGLRNLELDVFHDPVGGKYTYPKSLAMLPEGTDFDSKNELQQPGLKLFHVQDLDVQSHHLLFKNAILELKNWSNQNPDHHPVFVLINAKDGQVPMTVIPLTFSATALDSIDLEVRTHLSMDKLITPDLVRGNYESLEKAVLAGNWPEIDEVRGKFLFVLDENEEKIRRYLIKKPELKNAVLFVNLKEGNPEAGFRIINDPVSNESYIQDLVRNGYIIRTRADSDTKEARTGDYTKFEKAKTSGAQVISTDYYLPSRLFQSDYHVSFENRTFERENPILSQEIK